MTVPPTPQLPALAEDITVTVPPTPLLPALVEGMAVVAELPKQQQPLLLLLPLLPQQLQQLQLQPQLSLSPPDLAGDITVTVPPTPLPLALVEDITVSVPPTPLPPVLAEGTIVILQLRLPLLPQLLRLLQLPLNARSSVVVLHQVGSLVK